MAGHQFKIGQKVAVLDEAVEGVVSKIDGQWVTLDSEDGFLLRFLAHQLVAVSNGLRVTDSDVARIKKEKEPPKRKRPVGRKPHGAPKLEVDLHIEQLVDSIRGLDNFVMLSLQLETAERQLQLAMRKRIQKVVFIHGVGDGVLKESLLKLLSRYDNLKYYDAEYKKYGRGATEVHIYQNPSSGWG